MATVWCVSVLRCFCLRVFLLLLVSSCCCHRLALIRFVAVAMIRLTEFRQIDNGVREKRAVRQIYFVHNSGVKEGGVPLSVFELETVPIPHEESVEGKDSRKRRVLEGFYSG